MSPFLCQWLDRVAIRHAAAHMPKPDGRDLRLAEARRLLQGPELFPPDAKSAAIQFDGASAFHFESPRPSAHAVNNIVHGRMYRCHEEWRKKQAVLLLHGWNDTLNHRFFFPRHAARLNRMGRNAVTLQMPWQFDRRPPELGAWGNILTADMQRTVEGILQAMADIRALVNWLFEQGCPFVGLWGVSMGAWFAGLTVCHDARIGAAILVAPVARLDRLIDEALFCASIREVLRDQGVDLRKLNLVSNRPAIVKQNILLVEAEHDLFVAKENVEELWRAWDQPEIWRYRHAHISVLWARGLSHGLARWMAAKANERASK